MTRLIACSVLVAVAGVALFGAWVLQPESAPRYAPWTPTPTPEARASVEEPSEPAVLDRDMHVFLEETQDRFSPRYIEGLEIPRDVDPEPTFWRDGVEPTRVSIPSTGIDAPVILGELDLEARQMIAPEGPTNIAWYDFSALPGEGGNAVLAGHVDQRNYGPAVLWDLRYVQVGDTLEIDLSDGTWLQYRVDSNNVYDVQGGPWRELFQVDSGADMITLYTCDGSFVNGGYDARRVVQATLIDSRQVSN